MERSDQIEKKTFEIIERLSEDPDFFEIIERLGNDPAFLEEVRRFTQARKMIARRGDQIKQKTLEIVARLENDPAFFEEVRSNPVEGLQAAGLHTIMIAPFLRASGWPSLETPGFTPRNEAELEATLLVSSGASSLDICPIVFSTGTFFHPSPVPGPVCPGTEPPKLPAIIPLDMNIDPEIGPGEIASDR